MRDQEIAGYQFRRIFTILHMLNGERGGAVVWDTALQAGRSQVRFPMESLQFFIYIILPAAP